MKSSICVFYSFDDTNSQKLRIPIAKSGQAVDAFNFNPKCIDWEDYIINTHIDGLVKYVLKRKFVSII
ncbi:hypothetical protein Pint_31049 [Pistacia integerrima]|uniref:Uncharacterized protein n=1 Tax=Pistacia integerrima TaxID=434235 RepID=A0ACC0XS51_9ROSI|nr:hypothetical protein Pint_31049 [Pistacia integerrima]